MTFINSQEMASVDTLLAQRPWRLSDYRTTPFDDGIVFVSAIQPSEPLDATISHLLGRSENLVEIADGVLLSSMFVASNNAGSLLLILRRNVAIEFLCEHDLCLCDQDMLSCIRFLQDRMQFLCDVRMAIGERKTYSTIREKEMSEERGKNNGKGCE